MKRYLLAYLIIICLGFYPEQAVAAKSTGNSSKILIQKISDSLTVIANTVIFSDKINQVKIDVNQALKTIKITAGDNFGHLPFRKDNVDRIYSALYSILEKTYPNYIIKAEVYGRDIRELIPNHLSNKIDSSRIYKNTSPTIPLITRLSTPFSVTNGLQNRHIALWNSHGRHFSQLEGKWIWQRPRLFTTVEDLLTTSFVLPFLAPMLENAGANIFIPRERDVQTNEVIVDNDDKTTSRYRETHRRYHWQKGDTGFSNKNEYYVYPENPFKMGTYRQIKTTINDDDISTAEWVPDIPEKGLYAVYVAYQTTENSTKDARYTVHHLGGATEFLVNQTMFGGSWLYLGHFLFDTGINKDCKVTLSNLSKHKNKILTADAVKFGGGMGNIAVLQDKRQIDKSFTDNANTSNFPRFAEGAKYWLQWAGAPDSIYSRNSNTNEYSDDFQSRGFWVNYLSGGSVVNPKAEGLKVPIDLAFAFHTDAGISGNDSIVGTLGICTVNNNGNNNGNSNGNKTNTLYKNGVSRWAARDMVDLIQTQIVDDLKQIWHPEWTRRGIWNKSYSEARVPEVPTMLLELLSHQNFEDMKYALDPRFRFTVSRAIYKGILKHLAYTNNFEYVVQPLPVKEFSCKFISDDSIQLKWQETTDSLEITAKPDSFIVYTRINDGGFDNGKIVSGNSYVLEIEPGEIYSFKISAVNKGGESFPSEILSAYKHPHNKETVLIVNGFDRISGPENFNLITLAGFMTDRDAGVPYLYDISFTGNQYVFSPDSAYYDNENPGFGASKSDYENMVIAGNTFDYTYLHGESIKEAQYSFTSTSVQSVISSEINLQDYKAIDLILGKQKQTFSGKLKNKPEFQTFPLALQHKLTDYCHNGGNILVSGAYVASDMYDYSKEDNDNFVSSLLKVKSLDKDTIIFSGVLYESQYSNFLKKSRQFEYYHEPNTNMYSVEKPDLLESTDEDAFEICRYESNDYAAGIAYKGVYKACTLGFPFETIKDGKTRNLIMSDILSFFFNSKP